MNNQNKSGKTLQSSGNSELNKKPTCQSGSIFYEPYRKTTKEENKEVIGRNKVSRMYVQFNQKEDWGWLYELVKGMELQDIVEDKYSTTFYFERVRRFRNVNIYAHFFIHIHKFAERNAMSYNKSIWRYRK